MLYGLLFAGLAWSPVAVVISDIVIWLAMVVPFMLLHYAVIGAAVGGTSGLFVDALLTRASLRRTGKAEA